MANWALVVGINTYKRLRSLRYAERDAQLMRDYFENEAGFERVFYFADNSEEIEAPDGSLQETQPIYANLISFLHDFFEYYEERENPPLAAGDNLWFFFSGHGLRYLGEDYLVPSNGNPRLVRETNIALSYVTQRLRRSGADNVMLLLDACRNENELGSKGVGIEKQQGVITIASCSPQQESYEIEEIGQGSFTYALLEALRIQGEGNCATVERLYKHLQHRVAEINASYQKPVQTPYVIVEPASKYHLILLPDYATLTDIATLKIDAFQAEAEEDWELAKQLWVRVNMAARGLDLQAIQALSRIGGLRQKGEFRKAKEVLSRRFEAAMPRESRVGQRTEVRVMISLPDSLGLKNYLPDWTEIGDLIAKKDVVQNRVFLEFQVDLAQRLQPTIFWIKLSAPEFEILESTKSVFLDPRKNSGIITFFLTPNVAQKYGRVVVELFKDRDKRILMTSITLITHISITQDQIIKNIWQICTQLLTIGSSSQIEQHFYGDVGIATGKVEGNLQDRKMEGERKINIKKGNYTEKIEGNYVSAQYFGVDQDEADSLNIMIAYN